MPRLMPPAVETTDAMPNVPTSAKLEKQLYTPSCMRVGLPQKPVNRLEQAALPTNVVYVRNHKHNGILVATSKPQRRILEAVALELAKPAAVETHPAASVRCRSQHPSRLRTAACALKMSGHPLETQRSAASLGRHAVTRRPQPAVLAACALPTCIGYSTHTPRMPCHPSTACGNVSNKHHMMTHLGR